MEDIVNKIIYLATLKSIIFVAIDGMPGGGKSSLTKYILHKIPAIKLIKVDDFFNPLTNGDDINRLKNDALIPLKNGKTANFKIYDWKEGKIMEGKTIEPEGIILIEGICSMDKSLIDYYDYKIWIECPPEVGLNRALIRDNLNSKISGLISGYQKL